MVTTPKPERASRGGRPPQVTRDEIIAAAVRVIDADGLDGLTMRRLGAESGVAAMSLYRHLPNRAAVLAAVVDRLAAEAVIDLDPGRTWPEALTRLATNYRRMLLEHPNAVPLLATHPMNIDTGIRLISGVLDRFADAGVPQADALTAIQSVIVYVLGHALAQVGTPPDAPTAQPEAQRAAEYYQRWFTDGLTAMVAGFADRYRR